MYIYTHLWGLYITNNIIINSGQVLNVPNDPVVAIYMKYV